MGAAGYIWEYSIEGIEKVVSVSLDFVDDEKKTGPLPPGYSLDVLVTIEALVPGHATIHLLQRRSWKKEPLKEHVLEIVVKN